MVSLISTWHVWYLLAESGVRCANSVSTIAPCFQEAQSRQQGFSRSGDWTVSQEGPKGS